MRFGYKLGVVSFCDLTEEHKFKVYPLKRLYKDLNTGGSLTMYQCSSNVAYVETNSLTTESAKILEYNFKQAKLLGVSISTVCITDYGTMYKAMGSQRK